MGTVVGVAAGAPRQGRSAMSPVGLLGPCWVGAGRHGAGARLGFTARSSAGSSRAVTGNQAGFLHTYHSEGFSCVGALLSNEKAELPMQSLSLR